jgi:hypothetical protein
MRNAIKNRLRRSISNVVVLMTDLRWLFFCVPFFFLQTGHLMVNKTPFCHRYASTSSHAIRGSTYIHIHKRLGKADAGLYNLYSAAQSLNKNLPSNNKTKKSLCVCLCVCARCSRRDRERVIQLSTSFFVCVCVCVLVLMLF